MSENRIGLSVVYALLAALIGGIVWALIVVISNYELGLIAWGIGGMAGYAVVIPSKDNINKSHQIIAVIASLIGIVLGKYFFFSYVLYEGFSGLFDSYAISVFFHFFFDMFGGMDIVFVLLAVITAWQIPMKLATKNNNEEVVLPDEEIKQ